MTTVTINGHIYSDDSDPDTGMGGGGHRTRFVPALGDVVVVAGEVAADAAAANDDAASAAASAASALSAPGTSATSTASLTIGTGAKSLAIQAGKSLVIGATVKIAVTADGTKWMAGDITGYDDGTGVLDVTVTATSGSGTYAAWSVSLSGPPGTTDWSGISGKPTTVAGYGITDGLTATDLFWADLQETPTTRAGYGLTDAAGLGANAYTGAQDFVAIMQNIVAMAALSIDCSAGNYFTKTISGNSTFTFDSVPASRAFAFTLELTHTSGTVTWPATVKWPGDSAPSLTTGKTHVFVFITDDGGARWRGAALRNYTN